MVSLKLFGGASLESELGPLTGPAAQRRRLALLALLAATHPFALPRDKLIAYLWPERDTEHARNLLSQAVYVLRKALGEEAILAAGDELRFNPGVVACDVVSFEQALAAGELARAIALYAGPFLDGFFLSNAPEFERWVDTERERYRRSYGLALEALAERAAATSNFTGAVEWWRRLAAEDPYNSRVTLRLMEALDASGNRAGALQHAAIHQRLLQEDLGIEPALEVLALAERLRSEPAVRVERRGSEENGASGPGWAAPPEMPAVPAVPARRAARTPRLQRRWGGVAALVLVMSVLGALLWRQASTPREASAVAGSEMHPQLFSLAVLPLRNYSGDPGQEFFAEGMTEELITTLTKIEGLRVIAHQSVRQFKHSEQSVPEIARLLDVKYVVAGSVVRDGDRVRVTVNLIDAASNTSVWGERFERERRDVLALQREVTLAIARQIEITLSPQDRERLADAPQVDPEAFDLYVKGTQARYKLTAEGFAEARDYFERAVAKDPGYAPAHAGLAYAHVFDGDESQARRSTEKALELDPSLAEAHGMLGIIYQVHEWDWVGAEAALRQAIRLNPGYAEAHHELGMLLLRLKRFDEALRAAQHALYLAPMSARFQSGVGEVYLYAERYEEAVTAIEKALALDPNDLAIYQWLALAYGGQERFESAVEAATQASLVGWPYIRAYIGYLHAQAGKREEALEVLDTLLEEWKQQEKDDKNWPYAIAMIHAGLGEREQALEWLEGNATPGGGWWMQLAVEPTFRSLHAEPRFQTLLKKVGLEK